MGYLERDTLFLFLDESGNLDFSPKGTRYWLLTAFCTFNPAREKEGFLDLLYSLADGGIGQAYFHATEDKQALRNSVFGLIGGLDTSQEVHAVIAEKRKAARSLYRKNIVKGDKIIEVKDESKFYETVCRTLLRYVFRCPRFVHARKVVITLSSIFNSEKHEAIRKALTLTLKSEASIPFVIQFNDNRTDLNCQIADYCAWAIARKWEQNDTRSYIHISSRIRNEFDLFCRGTSEYY